MAPRKSWVQYEPDSHFSLANIPFGIISTTDQPDTRSVAIAIGDYALNLATYSTSSLNVPSAIQALSSTFAQPTLNAFAAQGRSKTSEIRRILQEILTDEPSNEHASAKAAARSAKSDILIPFSSITLHIPFSIGDYTDFYVGLHHAMNCGRLMRGPGQELQPNYLHLPVGYHGRASSVVVSGTGISRPRGQILTAPGASEPVLDLCRKLDFELELGCFVAKANEMGTPVGVKRAFEEGLFGVVLMNDWSARDIQTWEMVPLGPFNAKNFGTSVSGWVVTMDALEPFLVPALQGDRPLLDYLQGDKESMVPDIKLDVTIETPAGTRQKVTNTTSRNLLFSFPQMLAHHTVGGCPFNTGDLLGSGTISGTERGSFGSLFEQTDGGKSMITIAEEPRTFLADGDTVIFSGVCGEEEYGMVGFGECKGTILENKTRMG
ncbi:fumarylacetoacetase [Microthyrium microscopicum]|uniref:Fumarylacetoacetase n=1 Tax=Microthyrium microscopicum TaxID=703497 RepID=A0A6A6UAR7_9PEZI|nr:fumarylacetoacetase [Microthyrium microscopicum]